MLNIAKLWWCNILRSNCIGTNSGGGGSTFTFSFLINLTLFWVELSWIIMAMLLRKLCDSASSSIKRSTNTTNSSSSSRSHQHHHHHAPSPLGLFDSLPPDILLKITRLLGPKHAAKLCLVCKSWRSLVSDNELWAHFLQTHQPIHFHSILFSETNLTSGYPLP